MSQIITNSNIVRDHLFQFCSPETLFSLLSVNKSSRVIFESHREQFKQWYLNPLLIDISRDHEYVIYQCGLTLERRIYYHQDSNIVRTMEFYRNEKIHGPFIVYNETGEISYTLEYQNGLLVI